MDNEPSKADLNNLRYVEGLNKPRTQVVKEAEDPYLYRRWKAAQDLGVSPDQLNDEPDEMSDHSDDQGWD